MSTTGINVLQERATVHRDGPGLNAAHQFMRTMFDHLRRRHRRRGDPHDRRPAAPATSRRSAICSVAMSTTVDRGGRRRPRRRASSYALLAVLSRRDADGASSAALHLVRSRDRSGNLRGVKALRFSRNEGRYAAAMLAVTIASRLGSRGRAAFTRSTTMDQICPPTTGSGVYPRLAGICGSDLWPRSTATRPATSRTS